ncbi:MAG: alpha/beta hydrolase [Phycisphaerales bacterium]
MRPWTLPAPANHPIRGSSHATADPPRAVALFAHGFKGYKDYGFIPVLAAELGRRLPLVVHRFNFSHSGMGERTDTFEHPELFEQDTWSKQVADLNRVADAARTGELSDTPARLPLILIGHSRGGVTCLLAAGRASSTLRPRAVITLAAPDTCCSMSDADQAEHLRRGYTVTKSARTGQDLKIGRAWLQEQRDDPDDHDVLACCARIKCPVLAIHGASDPTVDPTAAGAIADAAPLGEPLVIYDGDHVFNTPNPADPKQKMSAPLATATDAIDRFITAALE